MNPEAVTFWFEFASSYSYPAAMRIEEVSRRYGRSVVWRPFLLGPIFRDQGWNDSPFNIYPAKGRYMWRDLERISADLGLPFRRPSQFPRNGLLAARIVCTDEAGAWVPEFVRRVYAANFAEDRDIADPEVLLDRLQGLLSDPNATLAAAHEETAKRLLRRNTGQAVELGIFGSPTLVVGAELFWGNDRIEAAFEWAAANDSGD